jgi:hypothetical protein
MSILTGAIDIIPYFDYKYGYYSPPDTRAFAKDVFPVALDVVTAG